MKKIFLLFFATLLFTNTFFMTNNSVSAESLTRQTKIGQSTEEISPTGIWFTEDDELP